jgi:hypothetical protein
MERSVPSLLARWQRARSAALADELDRLSDARTSLEPAVHPDEWLTVSRSRDPDALGPLLAALPPVGDPRLKACLDTLWRWPVDPRITTALQRLVLQQSPPSTAHGLWRRVLALVAWTGDVRATDWLAWALVDLHGPALATRRLVQRANELIVFLGQRPRGLPVDAPCGPVQAFEPAPLALEARQVFADELLSRGDVRGELIQLQVLDAPRPDQRRRIHHLVRQYGRAWLGRLSAALKPRGLRFERGVVVAGQLSGFRAMRTLLGAPEWATLESLDLRELVRQRHDGPLLARFLSHPCLARLTDVQGFPGFALGDLLRSPRPLRLTSLSVTGWVSPVEVDEVAGSSALQSLEHLTVNGARVSGGLAAAPKSSASSPEST